MQLDEIHTEQEMYLSIEQKGRASVRNSATPTNSILGQRKSLGPITFSNQANKSFNFRQAPGTTKKSSRDKIGAQNIFNKRGVNRPHSS